MIEDVSEKIAVNIANDIKKEGIFGNIDLHKARELMMDAGAILLDVRPPARIDGENAQEAGVKNAFFTPYPDFANFLEDLPQDKTTPIVTACLKGWFANRVMGYLEILGYSNVYSLDCSVAFLIEAHHAKIE